MIQALAGVLLRQVAEQLVQQVVTEATNVSLTVGCEVDVDGLLKFGRRAKKAVFIGAARAAKPVRAAVISEAQKMQRSGATARSIGTKVRIYDKNAAAPSFVTIIGPKMSYSKSLGTYKRGKWKGSRKVAVPFLYSWLTNKGTKRSRGYHWLDTAYASSVATYKQNVYREIEGELAKYLK